MEIWKVADGSNGHYEVSSMGRVRNIHTGQVLKPSIKYTGYCEVEFAYDVNKCFLVHRLVAAAFVDNPNSLKYVNHKDENKTNNIADNLEWCTAKYNCNYGNGALARNHRIAQKTKSGAVVKIWGSMKEAATHLNINYQRISRVCRGERKTTAGYIWEYV